MAAELFGADHMNQHAVLYRVFDYSMEPSKVTVLVSKKKKKRSSYLLKQFDLKSEVSNCLPNIHDDFNDTITYKTKGVISCPKTKWAWPVCLLSLQMLILTNFYSVSELLT